MADQDLNKIDVFPWNKNLETGHERIDEQHKNLVRLLNLLAEHLMFENEIELKAIFDELASYADYHFKTEEEIWQQYFKDDDWFVAHRKSHESFLPGTMAIKEAGLDQPLGKVIEEIIKFLIHWLAYHILDNDKRMTLVMTGIDNGLDMAAAKDFADQEMSGAVTVFIDTVLSMYGQLSARTFELMRERNQRIRVEVELREARSDLERQVAARTRELTAEIAERRQIELALRQSEERFRGASLAAADGIILSDASGSITFWNRAAQRIFGYSEEEIVGQPLASLVPHALRSRHKTGFQKAATGSLTEMATDPIEIVGLAKSGAEIPIEVSLSNWEVGGQRFFGAVVRDITERKHLESQIRHAQKMEAVGQLTGGIAHDFNNLLSIASGNLELLRDLVGDDERCERHIGIALQAIARGAGLTQYLLAYSRRQTLSPRRVDLGVLVADFIEILSQVLRKDITFHFHTDDDLWPVIVDPRQLETAILNLAINARDAMPNGGELTLDIRKALLTEEDVEAIPDVQPGNYLVLAMQDTGTGIDPADLEHVFEPFFSTKDVGQGSGLGLSMVYGFVKQSGGHINIDSRVGDGTTVKLYLPRTFDK